MIATAEMPTGSAVSPSTFDRAWDVAASRTPGATPFQTSAWLGAWVAAVAAAEGQTPLVLRLPDEGAGRLRLGLAMQLGADEDGNRVLSPLGSPWADYEECVGDAPQPSHLDVAADWLTGLAREHRAVIRCRDVVPDGLLAAVFARLPGAFVPSSTTVAIDLRDEAHVDGILARREYLAKQRRLQRLGELSTVHRRAPDEVAEAFPRFVDIHLRQWQGRDDVVAPFSEPAVLSGFREIALRCARFGSLVLTETRLGEVTLAAYLGFLFRDVYFAYRTCFDRAYFSYSPGHIMLRDMITDFRELGVGWIDLMRGGYAYKTEYGSRFGRTLRWSHADAGMAT